MSLTESMVLSGIQALLKEIFEGSSSDGGWLLNQNTRGILGLIDGLDAGQASRRAIASRSSIAAHIDHLAFGLSLLNRYAQGEENPFATADWDASWKRQTVSAGEWQALRTRLREQYEAWTKAVASPREWDETGLTGAMASAAHAAYHLGVIRQHLDILGAA